MKPFPLLVAAMSALCAAAFAPATQAGPVVDLMTLNPATRPIAQIFSEVEEAAALATDFRFSLTGASLFEVTINIKEIDNPLPDLIDYGVTLTGVDLARDGSPLDLLTHGAAGDGNGSISLSRSLVSGSYRILLDATVDGADGGGIFGSVAITRALLQVPEPDAGLLLATALGIIGWQRRSLRGRSRA